MQYDKGSEEITSSSNGHRLDIFQIKNTENIEKLI